MEQNYVTITLGILQLTLSVEFSVVRISHGSVATQIIGELGGSYIITYAAIQV